MDFRPTIVGNGLGALAFLSRTRDQQEGFLSASGPVSRDLSAVRERLTNVQNVDELLDDRQVLNVVLSSLGLEDDIDNKGFLRNVLMSDLNDPLSTANRLSEPKYLELAQTFNFAGQGGATFPGASTADRLTPQLQAVGSVEALFERSNSLLLTRALEVFGLEGDADRTVFLQQVLQSDLSDPTSLVNRIGDQRYVDFAAAFQNDVDRLPEVLRGKVSDTVATQLRAATSGADIVGDRRLLDAVLTQFGLADQLNNTSLIQAVLDSDLSDPASVANRLSNPGFQDLARAFDFQARQAEAGSVYALAELVEANPEAMASAEAFVANEALLTTALDVFGLDRDVDTDFLTSILNSDPFDPSAFVFDDGNEAYVAFSKAFGFGDALARPTTASDTRIDALVEAVNLRSGPATSAETFFQDARMLLAATNLFDLPQGTGSTDYTRRVLFSDPSSPVSAYQVAANDNYRNLFDALNFQPEDQSYSYPNGFADAVINSYVARQFEISVGEQDADMRLMLALERDLPAVVQQSQSNDGQWFRIMGTPSLRAVFEGAFNLPSSFAQLELDRQLEVFQEKAVEVFGTSQVADIASGENFDALQRRYLAFSAISGAGAASIGSTSSGAVLSLFV